MALVRPLFLRNQAVLKGYSELLSQGSVRNVYATNTIINFVPQQEAWVVERMGKFYKILQPGLNFLIPVIDKIKYVQSLKEIAIEIPQQGAITIDNVQLQLDVSFVDYKFFLIASYGVDDPEFAITQLAQTTMRSEVGKINLDTVFKEREQLNVSIVEAINKAADPWGLQCMRYEIRDMTMPVKIQEAMQMQVEAERKKRAAILESEGCRDAAINVAEGEKKAKILASEAAMQKAINEARGDAEAIIFRAKARAEGIRQVSEALAKRSGIDAASLNVAEQYVAALSNIAKETNTVVVPSTLTDASSLIAQSLSIYKQLSGSTKTPLSSSPSLPSTSTSSSSSSN
uniref:PHB domain-containing protein n=1 Tax=Syphacia muris TaxID=451379 RepID=A0A0N5AFM8_9BILA